MSGALPQKLVDPLGVLPDKLADPLGLAKKDTPATAPAAASLTKPAADTSAQSEDERQRRGRVTTIFAGGEAAAEEQYTRGLLKQKRRVGKEMLG